MAITYHKKTVAGQYYQWVRKNDEIAAMRSIKESDVMDVEEITSLPSGMSSATETEYNTAVNNVASWLIGGHTAHKPPN